MTWLYRGKPITPDEIEGKKAFVYRITNLRTGKMYLGKKRLQFLSRKKVKNSSRRKKVVRESDWADYYGSSKSLHIDIEKYGKDNFKREILHLCDTVGESSYWELHEQITTGALLKPDEYYNDWIYARVARSHLIRKK